MQLRSSNLLAPHATQCSPSKQVSMTQLGTGKQARTRSGTHDEVLLAGHTCEEAGRACAQATTCGATVSFGAPPCSHHNSICQQGVMSLGTNLARLERRVQMHCQCPSRPCHRAATTEAPARSAGSQQKHVAAGTAKTSTRQASDPCLQDALGLFWRDGHVCKVAQLRQNPVSPNLTGRASRLAPLSRPPPSRSAATLAAGADGSMPASLMRFSSRSRSI